jgi:hypothetical protein
MENSCSVPDCNGKARARGWCRAHYQRWQRHGDVGADRPLKAKGPPDAKCSAPGCEGGHKALGLCLNHYEGEEHA